MVEPLYVRTVDTLKNETRFLITFMDDHVSQEVLLVEWVKLIGRAFESVHVMDVFIFRGLLKMGFHCSLWGINGINWYVGMY